MCVSEGEEKKRCLVSVWLASREAERVSGYWKRKGPMARGVADSGFVRDGFLGLGFFMLPSNVQNCPPFLCVLNATIYRQNIVLSPNLVPQLLSFFVNLIFFWIFLINIDSNEENY